MDIKKFAPWNWLKHEESSESSVFPLGKNRAGKYSPLGHFHPEINRMLETMYKNFGFDPSGLMPTFSQTLKPSIDIASTAKEYIITVEIPGVEENDVTLELTDNILSVKGNKKFEKEEKDKNFYRVERSYGSFRRDLALPEDANLAKINAEFKNGLLIVTINRKEEATDKTKTIEIKKTKNT